MKAENAVEETLQNIKRTRRYAKNSKRFEDDPRAWREIDAIKMQKDVQNDFQK